MINLRPYQQSAVAGGVGYNQSSREQSRPPLGGGVLSKPLGHVCRLLAGLPTRENVRHAPRAFLFWTGMKTCSKCSLEKPIDAFYIRKKTGKPEAACKACASITAGKWARENPEKRKAVALKWAKANYPKIYANKARYRAEDPERMRKWSIENPERMQAARDRWTAANKHRKAEHRALRRARLRSAAPSWANRDEIAKIYRQARQLTQETNEHWEVDHIVPLAGKTVCGLHVEHNLRVLKRSANRKKGCSTWPDMP